MPTFLPYSDGVEHQTPDEQKTLAVMVDVMHQISLLMNDRYRHAVRSVHSKSHGLLKAELTVNGGLAEPYAQGLFARPGTYGAMIRYSSTPGDILADSISTPRGMAVKVVGVPGPMLPGHDAATQDFVFVNAKTFAVPSTAEFLKQQKIILANANDPEIFKKVVSNIARGANAVLGLAGVQSTSLAQLGHPETHPLGETYDITAALRYGNYVAKMIFEPKSQNLKALFQKHADVNFHFSGLKDAIVEFFKTQTAVWGVKVQLSTDLDTMPVEDPSKEWDEKLSPYVTVGTLTAGPQEAYSPQRRVYMDELMSFDPWHAMEAHRPLGNIQRARKDVYAMSRKFRHEMNGRPIAEPGSIDELPA